MIEYSAAADYIEAVYDHKDYFGGGQLEEDIYNGREDINGQEADLHRNGFELTEMKVSGLDNWTDIEQIRSKYLPQLENKLREKIDGIEHIIFWHPMYRGEGMDRSSNSAPLASSVHLDADIAAFELEELVELVTERSISPQENTSVIVRDALLSKNRFMIVNAWRNINDEPIMRAPLGLFLPNYTEPNQTYPWARLDVISSRWYTFPFMSSEEVLMFKQYDRRLDNPSDIWHCALRLMEEGGEEANPRKSLDLRAFCILNEEVPERLDRWRLRDPPLVAPHQSTKKSRPFVRSFLSNVKRILPFVRGKNSD
eukprot:CAMPEP_0202449096 /NCGR_PEP_ID=MMETSP1360-20130828/7856_1 /ASSEMBLY_ACC=CAM_ASM_000848 /TAXON_ID=515479 /ORGANISM="Licmophora paradoxa, Strain CCMP2313" /LENGTH=311 /DNA_ID=CAMNT_0049066915 /DNA_START=194 /DNA_END=1129 /DNA_ORIENTATION=+